MICNENNLACILVVEEGKTSSISFHIGEQGN
jgi:hypothetical protein